MIYPGLTPTQHQIILDCMTIAERQMRDNELEGVADLVKETKEAISYETQESSKTHESKNVLKV